MRQKKTNSGQRQVDQGSTGRGSRPAQGSGPGFAPFGAAPGGSASSAPASARGASASGASSSPFGPGPAPGPRPGGSSAAAAPPGRGFRNWRVRSRLTAILIVPVVAGLSFAGLRVADELQTMSDAGKNEQVSNLVSLATTVVDDLERERDESVQPLMKGKRNDPQVAADRQRTDQDIARLDAMSAQVAGTGGGAGEDHQLTTELAQFRALRNGKGSMKVSGKDVPVPGLQQLRAVAYGKLSPQETQLAYSAYFWPLMALDNELYFGSNTVNSRGRELYALTLAKASYSTERNLVMIGLVRGHLTQQEAIGIQVANKLTETAMNQVTTGGIPADLDLYNRVVSSPDLARADAAENAIGLLGLGGRSLSAAGVSPDEWYQLASVRVDKERQVEQEITDSIGSEAKQAKTDAQTQVYINSGAALFALLLSILLTGAFSRSLVRGMRTLRNSAQDIAANRLPAVVEHLSQNTPERVNTKVDPIPLTGRDEVGEVARAFDDVHRQAVRLASEQAILRGNVSAIFSNLSRRTQGLIERQIALITDLENNEGDPDQLESLFRLDHLATRMRRNGENLLVLAGEEPGRQWNQPIPLVDVLRAAASEVEEYERIELSGIPETDVVGPAVNDLVHLLAELLENATSFSSPQTRVRVTATRLPDQRVLVEIHDKGIGLSAEDFAEINAKLAAPSTLDASVSRQMGLYVVGRLAARHSVRVQLRASTEGTGTTSLVMIPDRLTQAPQPMPAEEEFTVSRIVGEADASAYADPTRDQQPRTAGELGFDESRWAAGQAGQMTALDSVRRSLEVDRRRRATTDGPEGQQFGDPQQYPQEQAYPQGQAYPQEQPFPQGQPSYPQGQASYPQGQAYPSEQQPFAAESRFQPGTPQQSEPQALSGQPEQRALESGSGAQAPSGWSAGAPGGGPSSYPAPSGYPAPSAYPSAPDQAGGYEQGQGLGGQRPYGGPAAGGGYPSGGSAYPAPQAPSAYPQSRPYGSDSEAEEREQAAGQEPASAALERAENGLPLRRPGQTIDAGSGIGSAADRFGGDERGGERGEPASPAQSVTPSQFAPATRPATGGPASGRPAGGGGGGQPNWFSRSSARVSGPASTGGSVGSSTGSSTGSSVGGTGAGAAGGREESGWRSPADDSWQQASQVQRPASGGTTSSGLPLRVPRQNLVPGNAPTVEEYTGPQISRDPGEVRGRLSSLLRGVEQGRSTSAETETSSASPDQHGGTDYFGDPHPQERQ
ncbi:nitrate- and nitrite sensing domain-containing protein [Phaeacidiphilus oryzae]|uniref:nitrate- and nitrite sensing domain-containing protein n=1 Tax=Phaeacidiphilus oryzae TaxID=348818 RepID=UPI00068B76B5|nr:nitrate- and nitrite sensing domain-containing protein [Phaeacidiphilus oryzae]